MVCSASCDSDIGRIPSPIIFEERPPPAPQRLSSRRALSFYRTFNSNSKEALTAGPCQFLEWLEMMHGCLPGISSSLAEGAGYRPLFSPHSIRCRLSFFHPRGQRKRAPAGPGRRSPRCNPPPPPPPLHRRRRKARRWPRWSRRPTFFIVGGHRTDGGVHLHVQSCPTSGEIVEGRSAPAGHRDGTARGDGAAGLCRGRHRDGRGMPRPGRTVKLTTSKGPVRPR